MSREPRPLITNPAERCEDDARLSGVCAQILGPDGPFARQVDKFVVRAGQQAMAARIGQALADDDILIAESGTGTGKTFAYLVPALLSGKKVLISTGTKTLQDQLFQRDLPRVRDLLGLPATVALLKGRANYLCPYRLEKAEQAGAGRAAQEGLARIRAWAAHTRCGDVAEMREVPEESPLWPQVTSTADNCLGSACPHVDACFVNRARREALKADVLIVNHHLFFADLVLREEGFGQLLPGVDAVIFDEAHQLPDIATHFFGVSVSAHQLQSLCKDTLLEEAKEQSGVRDLSLQVAGLEKAVADCRLALGAPLRRAALAQAHETSAWAEAFAALVSQLGALAQMLELAAGKGPGLANCRSRAFALLERLDVIDGATPGHVAWFETTARGFALHSTPADVSVPFQQRLTGDAQPKAWIFTSATLTVGGDFRYFQARTGLHQAATERWDSPFDYPRQALLYIPADLPDPSRAEYVEHVLQAVLPVLTASRGRAFLLFTSHRALKQAAERLSAKLAYPLLVQGTLPRAALLARFHELGNAVLLGTGSFWEGVDVRGEALSLVVIDKLPFAAPDDPVMRARNQALEADGRNAFMEHQLPEAVIALKQGAGRLIRDVADRGVLMLCDPRVAHKGYGRTFLASLPPMPITRALADVEQFFAV